MDKLERVARALALADADFDGKDYSVNHWHMAQAAIAALEPVTEEHTVKWFGNLTIPFRSLVPVEPVTVQEMPEVLTSEQLADACLWHRHDYGIASKGEQEARRRAANDWWRAFRRALAERGE